jgi:hypothetical protein
MNVLLPFGLFFSVAGIFLLRPMYATLKSFLKLRDYKKTSVSEARAGELAEIRGMAQPLSPLKAPYSGDDVAYCSYSTERNWDVWESHKSSKGGTHQRRSTKRTVLEEGAVGRAFFIDDGGRMLIGEGGQVDAPTTYWNSQPTGGAQNERIVKMENSLKPGANVISFGLIKEEGGVKMLVSPERKGWFYVTYRSKIRMLLAISSVGAFVGVFGVLFLAVGLFLIKAGLTT